MANTVDNALVFTDNEITVLIATLTFEKALDSAETTKKIAKIVRAALRRADYL
jgi:hypothetical protein